MRKLLSFLLGVLILFASNGAVAVAPVLVVIDGHLLEGAEAVIIEERTYVPLRAVAEGLGLSVKWDAENRSVVISSNPENLSPQAQRIQDEWESLREMAIRYRWQIEGIRNQYVIIQTKFDRVRIDFNDAGNGQGTSDGGYRIRARIDGEEIMVNVDDLESAKFIP